MSEAYSSYEDVSARLNQIVDEVNAEGVTLDEALALYEEAVKLGLRACDLSEEGAEALLAAQEEREVQAAQETQAAQEAQATQMTSSGDAVEGEGVGSQFAAGVENASVSEDHQVGESADTASSSHALGAS